MYQKPSVAKLGSFRELTRWGLQAASDGGSILGIGSPGCRTRIFGQVVEIDCPDPNAPSAS